jgi:SNF2 family DNA or RNA helicase
MQVLGLILSNPPQGCSGYPITTLESSSVNQGNTQASPRTTLIVTTNTGAAVWESYFRRHVNVDAEKPALVVDRYMGAQKTSVLKRIVNDELDVVLTTYDTLRSDFFALYPKGNKHKTTPKKKAAAQANGTLNMFMYGFYRVVLDAGKCKGLRYWCIVLYSSV